MAVRIEYLGFQNLADHRQYRYRVQVAEAPTECQLRIPLGAFGARVRLQDGPDVCYQKLLRTITAGEAVGPDVIDIDDAELALYRDAHTHVPKRRSPARAATTPSTPAPRKPLRTPWPARPAPPPQVMKEPEPGFEAGQRVRHAIFGEGVTGASSSGHTAVCFDQGGKKKFVTSILEVDVLSGPNAWETSARGVNRPSRNVVPDAAPADLDPPAGE